MIRYLRIPLIALGLLAFAGTALAQSRSCPYNDRKMPEKSNICRSGAIWVCEAGEWIRQEGTRCTPPKN